MKDKLKTIFENASGAWVVLALGLAFGLALTGCKAKENVGAKTTAKAAKNAAPATDFTYDMSENGEGVVIMKYTGQGGRLVIPAEIEGLPVIELARQSFFGEFADDSGPGLGITSVVIPASVKSVGFACFAGIENLTSVTFLGSDVKLGSFAFSKCINLSEINLPEGDNVLKPDENALMPRNDFRGCKKLPLAMRAKLKSWGFQEP